MSDIRTLPLPGSQSPPPGAGRLGENVGKLSPGPAQAGVRTAIETTETIVRTFYITDFRIDTVRDNDKHNIDLTWSDLN